MRKNYFKLKQLEKFNIIFSQVNHQKREYLKDSDFPVFSNRGSRVIDVDHNSQEISSGKESNPLEHFVWRNHEGREIAPHRWQLLNYIVEGWYRVNKDSSWRENLKEGVNTGKFTFDLDGETAKEFSDYVFMDLKKEGIKIIEKDTEREIHKLLSKKEKSPHNFKVSIRFLPNNEIELIRTIFRIYRDEYVHSHIIYQVIPSQSRQKWSAYFPIS